MIHISIGTAGNAEGLGPSGYLENMEREFLTADEALAFLQPYAKGMYSDDWRTITSVLQGCREGEYVDPGLEIRNNGGYYTNFHINIEGRQDPNWQALKEETQRAMMFLMQDGEASKRAGAKEFINLLNGAYAVANAVLKHQQMIDEP